MLGLCGAREHVTHAYLFVNKKEGGIPNYAIFCGKGQLRGTFFKSHRAFVKGLLEAISQNTIIIFFVD